ncbi:MAG: adenosylmethionine--8-amino-7-oxononanoate transaminase [Gammaproteobacteria bacterium]|nr:adenosylmethionine--8-amino-7-oxononanoate transaminase [Gammaproteobacteria bacterium]
MKTDIDVLQRDRQYVWHPYSSMDSDNSVFEVESAAGVRLRLKDGRELIDGMSSWWCAIHGYNHPVLNQAVKAQLDKMSHVMFGGLTHQPAVDLAEKLVMMTPASLQNVFFSDSGSVAVEVAMKMAIQYWYAKQQPDKQHFLTIRSGYHGDTFGAMSVCDPVTGMHSLFSDVLTQQYFVDAPACRFGERCTDDDIDQMKRCLQENAESIAAVILEPIVQGAGGMRFYSADYLQPVRQLCTESGVLLILDEIATGFGRTGKMFACEHADIAADIMCVGKALTGGYMSLAATLTTAEVSTEISTAEPGVFMHGPTFMANPLACATALASIKLLLSSPWQRRVSQIETLLLEGLAECRDKPGVADVRVLGAIGVVELEQAVDMSMVTEKFVDLGVWIRPFGRLVYLMPPYVINESDLRSLTSAVVSVVNDLSKRSK